MTGLNIQLEGALKLWEIHPEQSKDLVAQAKQMGSMALQETRQAVATLRTETLQQRQELSVTIAPLLQNFERTTGIIPQVNLDSLSLSPTISLTIYRILQELLTNICKYAEADRVQMTVEQMTEPSEPPQRYIKLAVEDNGVGFHPENNTTGFGLRGIQERAAAAGGYAEFISAPGQGCRVQVCLPLPEAVP
ncbi:sensor histidine kinase [Roseofilum casamattae]|uniref:Oxygen sensor histidine kinase NreB n=1 Tax=Roseofilum casamattae BLCC-M143 TaxID=3022442 RepID=A0ABT7C315_9CYAN|nr:ATP-binding protein [Roseofilum casamattae]MDJ1185853.1 ATP-binding protein [Roseofilum casamattae BLCC-M143]